MGYSISDCLKFCCRFQSYLDHLAMQENDEDSECEELERKMFQCKERTVSSHLYLYPYTHQGLLHTQLPA